jgi:hypothetical protein
MGRIQAELTYFEAVLVWLKEYWTGPTVQVYRRGGSAIPSRPNNMRQMRLAPLRSEGVIDLPAFLPLRNPRVYSHGGSAK